MSSSSQVPILRFARATSDLNKTLHFYQQALGLDLIASFDNHREFDGRILALPPKVPGEPAPWHLEFTYQHPSTNHPHGVEEKESVRAPSKDNLLVLYLKDKAEVETRKERMVSHGYHPVQALNPYWDDNGVTFEDDEGWRVVLCWIDWKL